MDFFSKLLAEQSEISPFEQVFILFEPVVTYS